MILLGLLLPALQQEAAAQYPALAPAHLRADVQYLASDELEGRETGERGEQVAGRWIEARFRRLGLQAPPGGFLQPFPAEPLHLDLARTRLTLISGPQVEQAYEAGNDFIPHPGAPQREAQGGLVFAGYGLHAPAQEYDDFADLDLHGKVVLLFRWEPQADDAQSRFDGRRLLPQTRLCEKVRACERLGAVAVLVANPPGQGLRTEAQAGYAWPELSPIFNQLEPLIEAQGDPVALQRTNFTVREAADQAFMSLQFSVPLGCGIPVAYVSQKVVEQVFEAAGRQAADWVKEVDASGSSDSFDTLLNARLEASVLPVARTGRNVVGLLPGSDPVLADQYLVLSAHYDHVGRNAAGVIWNGADDNASGTAALLALAESFASEPRRPRRTLAFAAFSGEEEGLVGSARLLAQGGLPEEKIAALLNLDMVGRSINRSAHVLGSQSSPALRSIVDKAALNLGLHLDYESEEFFDRSDQAPFYYAGIPVLFVNTSEHPDYHSPTDTWEKLDYDAMSSITVLSRRVASTLADLQKAPEFQDGYHRLNALYGRDPDFHNPVLRITYDQRMDY